MLINLRYTRQGSPLQTPDRVWNRLDRAYDWSLWLLLAGLVLVVVWGLLTLPAAIRRREARPAALVGIAVARWATSRGRSRRSTASRTRS